MNILGSDFIELLLDGWSSFEDDVLKIAVAFPDRYDVQAIDFDGAVDTSARYAKGNAGRWNLFKHPDHDCLNVLQAQFDWKDVLEKQFMGLDLHYQGDDSYFINILKVHFQETVTSYEFKMEITRDLYIDIPWMIDLKDEVELNVEFTVAVPTPAPTDNPTKNPSVSPTYFPSTSPSTSKPSVEPSMHPTTTIPSNHPTLKPTTSSPSASPTAFPSHNPSTSPETSAPSHDPTLNPSVSPTTSLPTKFPSLAPTTSKPSVPPTKSPTRGPTVSPSRSPTPREERVGSADVEAWQSFSLADIIDKADHPSDELEVMSVTSKGNFYYNGAAVTVQQKFSPDALKDVVFQPPTNPPVASDETVTMVIQGDHIRYTISINLLHPDACVGEWSAYTTCTKTCGIGTYDRTYSVKTEADPFGEACEQKDGFVSTESCSVMDCPDLDKVVLELGVAQPDFGMNTKVSMNFTTLVNWPWKVDPSSLKIVSETTNHIVDNSDKWYTIKECIPTYTYGNLKGNCVTEDNTIEDLPAIYIRGIDPNNPICKTLCDEILSCEAYDVYYDRNVCEIIGKAVTSADVDYITTKYKSQNLKAYFFFEFDLWTPRSPAKGNDIDRRSCHIRNQPVYEGDCEQKWHGEFLMDTVCGVDGSYTLQVTVINEELSTDSNPVTSTVDVTMDISVDTVCSEVVATVELEGTIKTFSDDTYSFASNIYHVGDAVFVSANVVSKVELTGLSLVGLVAQTSEFTTAEVLDDVVAGSEKVVSLSTASGNQYETTVQFNFRLNRNKIVGTTDGAAAVIFATFEAEYADNRRRRLTVNTDAHSPVGAKETMILYPAPCLNPNHPHGKYLTEYCGDNLRIRHCNDQSKWATIVDDCASTAISDYSVGSTNPTGEMQNKQIGNVNMNDNPSEKTWFTLTLVAGIAFIVGLSVYFYIEKCYKDKKFIEFKYEDTTHKFYDPNAIPQTNKDTSNDFEPEDPQEQEVSVSSDLQSQMDEVFEQVFNKKESHKAEQYTQY